jgi:hypothetical protein
MTRSMAALILLLSVVAAGPLQITPNSDRIQTLQNIIIEPGETVHDVQCFVCSVRVRGHVAGDIVTVGGAIFVEGTGSVSGNAVAAGGRIETYSQSKISGDAVAVGGYVQRAEGSAIGGKSVSVAYVVIPGQYRPTLLGGLALAVLNVFFVALAYVALQEKRAENTSRAIERRVGSVLFSGVVLLGLLYGLDSLTRHLGRAENGADIALLTLVVVMAAAGAAGLGYWVARIAFPNTSGFWAATGGILALTLLELVPLLGFLVFAVGLLLSLGAVVVSRFGSREVTAPSGAS